MYTLEDYILRVSEELAAGHKIMKAELCPKCYGRVPVIENMECWPDVKACECGDRVVSIIDMKIAHGVDSTPISYYPVGFQKVD